MNLSEIETKLAALVEANASILRVYADLFFSDTPKNVTIDVLNSDLALATIQVPNLTKTIDGIEASLDAAIIRQATTIYVSPAGSDSTGKGTLAEPYATISAAMNAIRWRLLVPGITVTIQLDDGRYPLSAGVQFNHPCGSQITLTGKNTYETTTSAVTVSGSVATVTVLNTDHIAAGDMVIIRSPAGGTNPEALGGAYLVAGVTGNQIALPWPDDAETIPAGSVVATVTVLKSVIDVSVSGNAFNVYAPFNFSRFGINGIVADTQTFSVSTSRTSLTTIGFTGVKMGVIGRNNSEIFFKQCGFSNIADSAIYMSLATFASIDQCAMSRLAANGIIAYTDSTVDCINSTVAEAQSGVSALGESYITLRGGNRIRYNHNGCFADGASTIGINPTDIVSDNVIDLSPAGNTIGNHNSIIVDSRV